MITYRGGRGWGKTSNYAGMAGGREEVLKLIDSYNLEYPGYHGNPSDCDVRVWGPSNRSYIFAEATWGPDNRGTSIQNRFEVVSYMVYERAGKPPHFIYIEHYPASSFNRRDALLQEHWLLVRASGAAAGKPEWTRLSEEQVMAVITHRVPWPYEWELNVPVPIPDIPSFIYSRWEAAKKQDKRREATSHERI